MTFPNACGTAVRSDQPRLQAAEPDRHYEPSIRAVMRSVRLGAFDRNDAGPTDASRAHRGSQRRELSPARQSTPNETTTKGDGEELNRVNDILTG